MAEKAAGFDFLFQSAFGRQVAMGCAAHFNAKLQRGLAFAMSFPLDGEPYPGALIGVLPQLRLVGVAIIKAGRERVAALGIEELRKNFDDAPRRRFGGTGDRKEANCCKDQNETTHEPEIAMH